MLVKTYKIFSYCDDFTEEEQKLLEEYPCDVFVEYVANSNKTLNSIADKLVKLGAEEGEKVLIHIDY